MEIAVLLYDNFTALDCWRLSTTCIRLSTAALQRRRCGRSARRELASGDIRRSVGTPTRRNGSPGRARTSDKAVNSRLLYQLSYRGMWAENRLLI